MAPNLSITLESFITPSADRALRVGFSTSSTSSNPIFPATYLQLSYRWGYDNEMFSPEIITPRDLVPDTSGNGVQYISVPFKDIPIPAVSRERVAMMKAGMSCNADDSDAAKERIIHDAEVVLHAWKDLRYLNSWKVGHISNWTMVY